MNPGDDVEERNCCVHCTDQVHVLFCLRVLHMVGGYSAVECAPYSILFVSVAD